MTYQTVSKLYSFSVCVGVLLWIFLIIRLIWGLIKKNGTVKSTIKYLTNSLIFLFVYVVYFSFAIVVNGPQGEERVKWVRSYSIEWLIWAIGITTFLAFFNIIYGRRIEKMDNVSQVLILTMADLLIMCYGIFLGGRIALGD